MKEQLPISLVELTILSIYLGAVAFLLGSLIVFWIIKQKPLFLIAISIISQLIIAIAAAVLIWALWPFKFDIMFGFLALPALLSEIITIPILVYLINRIEKQRK